MIEKNYDAMLKRYNALVESIDRLTKENDRLRLENQFVKNEKTIWSQEKNKQNFLMVKTITDFNKRIADMGEEINRLRDMIKILGGDP